MRCTRVGVMVASLVLAAGAVAQDIGAVPNQPGYHGHKWVRVTVNSARQLQTVLTLSEETLNCTGHGIGTFDVRMQPAQFQALQQTDVPHSVLFDDIQAAVEAERADIEFRRANPLDFPSWYDNYKTLAEVQAHVQALAEENPALATYVPIGHSLSGLEIFAIRITGPGPVAERPAVVYTGTQHAREWVSPMTVTYIAEHLITDYATDPLVKAMVDNTEFLIIPFVNPDGYDYTWASPNNRLWRKNLRPPPTGSLCWGVDPNRNWGFQWGGNWGSSPDPCSQIYRGTSAFSEPETQVVRDYVTANLRIEASIDFHSYSQLVMSPWGYTSALPPDHPFFQVVSAAMSAAIESVHGMTYVYGPGYTTIYPTTGSVKDWMYGDRGILGWTIELRDTGTYGFILPAQFIIPTAEENFAAIKAQVLHFGTQLVFTLPLGAPAHVAAAQPNPVQVEINPGVQTMQPGSARLFYRIGTSGPATNIAMTHLGDNVFQADLPAAPCGATIQYVFQAVTAGGQAIKYPAVGFAQPFQTKALQSVVMFDDNCEAQAGWFVGGPGSNATQGVWVRNDPQGTLAQPEDDHTPGTVPRFCYVTGHLAGVNVAQYDVDGGSTILTSPTLTGVAPQPLTEPELWLRYWRWYSNDKGLNPNADSMLIQISNDDGFSWTTLEEVNENLNTWVMKEFRVSDILGPTTQMKVRFIASDLGQDSVVEALVDDVQLRVVGCPAPVTCYADCNGDSNLTIADFGCFQTKFVAGDPYADCNAAGGLTIADFGCFQTKFVAGCP